jgi:DNA-binding MarR family transcriptional regulator
MKTMETELEPTERDAFRALLLAHSRVTDRIEADLARAGLPPLGWYELLETIHGAPQRTIRMFELADAISMSRSGLTRLIDRLEREGLLARRTCPSDRRGQFVVITDAGVETLHAMWPAYAAAIRRHFSSLLAEPCVVARQLGAVAATHAMADAAT